MDRAAFGGQPDQQGRLQDQAAALDQSTLDEFDSVLDAAALASQDSSAGDSAVRSADQDLSSDEYSELIEDSALQLGALGAAPDARSNRIVKVIFPPEDKLHLYQRFDTSAPGTAHALEAQMARIRYDAADWTPKSVTVGDSGSMPSHSEDSERVLRADASTGGSWLPPPVDNLWGERPAGYRKGRDRYVTVPPNM